MDQNKEFVCQARVERTLKALAKNRIPAVYVPNREEAVKTVESMLRPGDVVTCGGSMTLAESGVRDLLKSGDYQFLDREIMDPEEVYRRTFSADVFLMSANAITEEGQLYNVDGNGNRVAALIYGPKRVIVVAGINKLVPNLEAAIARVKCMAAPANGVRLETRTPCSRLGRCASCQGGETVNSMTEGCASEKRMCCQYVVTGYQRTDRIRVVLVGEELGY